MTATATFRVMNRGNLKALAEVVYGEFHISGLKVLASEKGLWVGMPSRAYKKRDGSEAYAPIVWIEDDDRRRAFQNWLVGEYQKTEKTDAGDHGNNNGSGARNRLKETAATPF